MTARGQIVCSDKTSLFVHPLIGHSGPHWGEYEETEVWYNDLAFGETFNLVQRILELNSKTMGLIPDRYRAISMDVIINMRDMLSW
jgi:hypothetical protein